MPGHEDDGWAGLSGREPRGKAQREKAERRLAAASPGDRVRAEISQVGDRTPAGLACPKCGGTNFKAKRSRGAKILLAPIPIAIAAAPKSRVKCVTCGTEYQRG